MKIGIVGAGIAGLSAARALVREGHSVRVFERAHGPGGRCATRVMRAIELPRGLSGEVAFDHGAQYFTVRDDRFSEVAAELARDKVISRWNGRIVSFDGEGWEPLETETARYTGTPGMNAIAAWMAQGLDISFNTRIASADTLLTEFDHVILAMPPAQAAAIGVVVPEATTKPCWTVMAAFEERVPSRFDAAFVNGNALSWIARNGSKPKRNWTIDTWVLHASTAWSTSHLDDQPEDVGAFLMEAFGDLITAGLPKAFFAAVHRWRYATVDPPLAIGAWQVPDARITLCGDWCLGTRIEDAWLSGVAAAERATGDRRA